MAINFSQKKKTQKYMILIFIIILLTVVSVVWFGLVRKPQTQISTPAVVFQPPEKIEINFEALRHPFLRDAQPFEEIQPFSFGTSSVGTIGRENPFIKY